MIINGILIYNVTILNSVYAFCVQTGSLDSSVSLVTDRQGRSVQCHSTYTLIPRGHSGRGQLTSY